MAAVIETIRSNPRIGAAVGSVLVVVGVIAIWAQVSDHWRSSVGNAFFTVDDGATLFTDGADRLPPFEYGGKEAVLAAVYSCDNGHHRWVQYLLKYSREGLDAVQSMKAAGLKHPLVPSDSALVKRPGDQVWIPVTNSKAQAIMSPRIPDGQTGPPLQVRP